MNDVNPDIFTKGNASYRSLLRPKKVDIEPKNAYFLDINQKYSEG
jgi:hypothetical protein